MRRLIDGTFKLCGTPDLLSAKSSPCTWRRKGQATVVADDHTRVDRDFCCVGCYCRRNSGAALWFDCPARCGAVTENECALPVSDLPSLCSSLDYARKARAAAPATIEFSSGTWVARAARRVRLGARRPVSARPNPRKASVWSRSFAWIREVAHSMKVGRVAAQASANLKRTKRFVPHLLGSLTGGPRQSG